MIRFIFLFLLAAETLSADVLVSTRTIRPYEVISPMDVTISDMSVLGTLTDPSQAVGMEAKIALYPGRPIRIEDVGPAAIVDRNGIITLVYEKGGLQITTEGRALGRGAPGETIRIMNLSSRTTVFATIQDDGRARVQ